MALEIATKTVLLRAKANPKEWMERSCLSWAGLVALRPGGEGHDLFVGSARGASAQLEALRLVTCEESLREMAGLEGQVAESLHPNLF